MRISLFSLGLLALLTPLTGAWSKDDREIFRIRDELSVHEGPDVTFYDFLGVPPSASHDDISKAYRKKSRALHPDKVKQQLTAERAKAAKAKKKKGQAPGVHVSKPPSQSEVKAAVKRASERQARLSLVANILRGPGRERYDHFIANGFPVWKGTEYYYSRYRPGLGTVLAGVFLFGGGAAHYIALYMSWKRQREFVERYIKFARHAAWGDNLGINVPGVDGATAAVPPPPPPAAQPDDGDEQVAPVAVNRRQRRMQEQDAKRKATKEGSSAASRRSRKAKGNAGSAAGSGTATPQPAAVDGPTGARKKVVAENGKVLIVDSLGDVYLEAEDEDGNVQAFLLDPNEIARPRLADTAIFRLPVFLYEAILRRASGAKAGGTDADDFVEALIAGDDNDDDSSEPGKRTPSTDSAEDFELLEKSVDSLDQAKVSGSQMTAQSKGGKSGRRKGRKN